MSQPCPRINVSSGCPETAPVCCTRKCQGNNGTCGTVSEFFCLCDTGANLNEKCPGPGDVVAYSTQIIVDGNCVIPEPKPDAEKLLRILQDITVVKAITVDSQEPRNGQMTKGKKVLVAGFLKLGFEYSALEPQQKVHFFECEIPFEALVYGILDGEDALFPPDFNLDNYIIHVCIEQLEAQQLGPRCFSKVGVLMIWLEPKR